MKEFHQNMNLNFQHLKTALLNLLDIHPILIYYILKQTWTSKKSNWNFSIEILIYIFHLFKAIFPSNWINLNLAWILIFWTT